MKRVLFSFALSFGFLAPLMPVTATAQEAGCPEYYDCGNDSPWTNGKTLGYSTNFIDLDLDGKTDFRLIERTAGGNRGEELPYVICQWTDDTEALFAEPHVQMYMSTKTLSCIYTLPEARLTFGQSLPAKPTSESEWQWIQPTNVARLKGIGFGWTKRNLRYGHPSSDTIALEPSYVHFNPSPPSTNVLFGFRIRRETGWHLGWLRLHYYIPDPTHSGFVGVAEFSVNPIPDQDVIVGVKMGTFLEVNKKGTNILNLSWSTNATNMVLEQKLKLSDPAWTVVAGITNNQYMVTPTNPSSFYRLKGSP